MMQFRELRSQLEIVVHGTDVHLMDKISEYYWAYKIHGEWWYQMEHYHHFLIQSRGGYVCKVREFGFDEDNLLSGRPIFGNWYYVNTDGTICSYSEYWEAVDFDTRCRTAAFNFNLRYHMDRNFRWVYSPIPNYDVGTNIEVTPLTTADSEDSTHNWSPQGWQQPWTEFEHDSDAESASTDVEEVEFQSFGYDSYSDATKRVFDHLSNSYELDEVVMHNIETMVITLSTLYVQTSYSGVIGVCAMFSKIYCKSSYFLWMNEYIKEILVECFETQADEEGSWEKFKKTIVTWKIVNDSELLGRAKKVVALLVTAGVCSSANLPFGKATFESFYEKSGVKSINSYDLILQVCDCFVFIVDKCMNFFVPGREMCAFYSDSDAVIHGEKYAKVMGQASLMAAGQLDLVGIDLNTYVKDLHELEELTKKYLLSAKGVEKHTIAGKLVAINKLQSSCIQAMREVALRSAPFSFVLKGPTAVGKSVLVSALVCCILRSLGIKPEQKTIVSLNASDKYQSEYNNMIQAVILDDISNILADKAEGNPMQLVIDLCNNDPKCALQAEADMKGKVYFNPKIVVATTNTRDLQAHMWSEEPTAILRRFLFHIEVSVKPAFRRVRADGKISHMLDPSKLDPSKKMHDAWDFDVYTAEAIPSAIAGRPMNNEYVFAQFDGKKLQGVGVAELIKFLQFHATEYASQQEHLVKTRQSMYLEDMCPHGIIKDICPQCSVEEEMAGLPVLVSEPLEVQAGPLSNNDHIYSTLSALYRVCRLFYLKWPTAFDKVLLLYANRMGDPNIFTFGFVELINCSKQTYTYIMCGLTAISFMIGGTMYCVLYVNWLAAAMLSLFWLDLVVGVMKYITRRLIDITINEPIARVQSALKNKGYWAKACGGLFLAYATVKTIRSLYGLYVATKPEPQGAVVSAPVRDAIPRENQWRVCELEKVDLPMNVVTSTFDQIAGVVTKRLAHGDFKYKLGGGLKCDLFPLKGNYWLAPWHVLKNDVSEIDVTFHDPSMVGRNTKIKCSLDVVKRIGETDMAIIYLPGLGVQRDLTPWLPLSPLKEKYPAAMFHKNDKGEVTVQKFNVQGATDSVFGVTYDSLRYNCETPTFPGLCMAPIIQLTKPLILGFHSAGCTGKDRGVGHQVTQKQVDETIESMNQANVLVFQAHSSNGINLESQEFNIYLRHKIHEKSPVNFLTEGTLHAYGAHTGQRRHYKSDIRESLLSPFVAKHLGIEKSHGPPQGLNSWMPWQKQMTEMTKHHELDHDMLKLAFIDFKDHIVSGILKDPTNLERIHPYDDITIVCGADGVHGVEAMKLSTSAGFPRNVSKRRYVVDVLEPYPDVQMPRTFTAEIWKEVKDWEEILSRGERVHAVFRSSLKDEAVELGSEKVRVFAGSPIALTILVRKYFLSMVSMIMTNSELFECAVGVNAYGRQWTGLSQHIFKHGKKRMIAGDYSKYDLRVAALLTLLAFKLLIYIAELAGYTQTQLTIMRGIATEICFPIYEFNGEFVGIDGTGPSGHGLTVIINNIVNSLYVRYGWYAIYKGKPPTVFADSVSLMCYGDDNIMSVARDCGDFNHTALAEALGKCGVKYTMADKNAQSVPYIGIEECTFLKRRFVWNADYDQYLGPIAVETLYKMLHCEKKSELSHMEYAALSLENVNSELFYHGKEIFNLWHPKLMDIAREAGVTPYLSNDKLSDFADLEELYLSKLVDPLV